MNKIKKADKPDLTPDRSKGKKIKSSRKKTLQPKYKTKKIKAPSKRIKAPSKAKSKQVKIKYGSTQRWTRFASKSQIQKHLVNGKYVFSKAMQKEFNILHARFGLSEKEYLNLYYGVRKANAKGARLSKIDSLYHVKYSRKFKNTIMTREDYVKYMKSISNVLSRDYKERKNKEFKERFMRNIELILSDKAAKNINELIKNMSADELSRFIDENPDLEKVMYESDPEKFTTFDKEATSMIENRLLDFLGRPVEDLEFKYDISDERDLIKRR